MPAAAAGQRLSAAYVNALCPLGKAQNTVNTTFGSTASTTYTPTLASTGTCTLAFVTPASGAIEVFYTASISPQASGRFGVISVSISGAAGTVAASDDGQAFNKSTSATVYDGTVSRRRIFTGLTPGAVGTITMEHKVIGGTVNFNDRQLAWEPVPA